MSTLYLTIPSGQALSDPLEIPNEGFWPYETMVQRVVPNTNLLLPSGTGISISGFVKFRSGTSAQPVAESGTRVFEIMVAT